MTTVLHDNEEVFFELESFDLWLHVVFNMYSEQEPLVYGTTEFRIDKNEKISDFKKKLQKFSINMWSKMLKGTDSLYTIEMLDLKTEEDTLNNNYFNFNPDEKMGNLLTIKDAMPKD